MKTAEIRRRFLNYFIERDHHEVPSAPLIYNDPTLLFVNAGMVPFKDTFLGLEPRPYTRATASQKVLRVSGKHNDLEEVGPSPRHHTFFEMLGNFSFGDYFKRDAIRLAWDFLINELELPVERLWFTVFAGTPQVPADEEAERLWLEAGAAPDRVLRFGEKDNFWVMGDTGPCGPNSEITMYIGEDLAKMRADGVNSDDPDYVEIWNLVFMQYDRATMQPLPRPGVDTGMGLERTCMVLQGVHSTYETDLFVPIIERTMELAGGDTQHFHEHYAAYRAVADHTRACTFLIADGILPGNEGRSYVLRRILRRAAYQGRTIGLTRPFLAQTADVVIDMMGDAYPDLRARRDFILEMISGEEERFNRTISSGLVLLDQVLADVPPGGQLSGDQAFTLYDTFGFPFDLTHKIATERGIAVDEEGYQARMEEQRERARRGAAFKRGQDAGAWSGQDLPSTTFTGYTAYSGQARVLALRAADDFVHSAVTGQRVQVVLDQTPFYAEGGGQVGDTGVLVGPHGLVRVEDTQRPLPGLIVHYGVLEEGTLALGETVLARVEVERRLDIMRNHTATHLLHRVIRELLGEHAAQAGSLVAPDRLRFDFTHARAIPAEQVHEIERRVNAWIRADTPVEWEVTDFQAAIARGAMALFGEKYGDRVRMVIAGCAATTDEPDAVAYCSRELCGGTHVARTGEIGALHILSESSSASGIRRIEAITGRAAEEWAIGQATTLREAAGRLNAPVTQVLERIDGLLAELRQQQRDLDDLRARASHGSVEKLLDRARRRDDLTYLVARVEAQSKDELGTMADWLRDKLRPAAIVLGAVIDDKPQVLAVVTEDLVIRGYHAGNLIKALAPNIRGGGKPNRAQGGGSDAAVLDEALAQAERLLAAPIGSA
ncbi:MAG TPA: alanine--tRNA ligase [Chloroflexota bacterium]|nr:alanine--tRNA ligase [Chloroflexota bacterium]